MSKEYVKERVFIRDRPKFWNMVQYVFVGEKFGPSRRMRNSIALISSNREQGSAFWVARVILLSSLTPEKDSGETEYIFLQYRKCTQALDEVDKELDFV